MSTEIAPLTERQQTLIVNNVLEACEDITKLNKQGYNFLYLCQGFIAHYNQNGFIEYYKEHSLAFDILNNIRNNQWANFREGERDYEYYMTKRRVYNRIVDAILNKRNRPQWQYFKNNLYLL